MTDIFSVTPKGAPNPFAVSKLTSLQQQQGRRSPTFTVAEDKPVVPRKSPSPPRAVPSKATKTGAAKTKAAAAQSTKRTTAATAAATKRVNAPPLVPSLEDSGYHGSQTQDVAAADDDEDELACDIPSQPFSQPTRAAAAPEPIVRRPVESTAVKPANASSTTATATATKAAALAKAAATAAAVVTIETPSNDVISHASPTQPTVEPTFHLVREEQTVAVPTPVPQPEQIPTSPMDVVETMSSSPFQPVESPSPVRVNKISSPLQPSKPPPKRKPVPAPSSPLQSTTPACPPPRDLLSAFGVVASAEAVSPVPSSKQVSPAVPTPTSAPVPEFIVAEKEATVLRDAMDVDDDEGFLGEPEKLEEEDAVRSPSGPADPSSPTRPVVRKSSINFAALPARELFTSNKSVGVVGVGTSRASHIDPVRTSYYNRPTGGKSLGNGRLADREDDDGFGGEEETDVHETANMEKDTATQNKTYAQRLHDRISMLGKSQANGPRPSKSLAALALQQESQHTSQQKPQQKPQQMPQQPNQQKTGFSPKRSTVSVAAPGAFPEDDDDDDDWIVPPAPAPAPATRSSPRLNMAKSISSTKASEDATVPISGPTAVILPKQRQLNPSRSPSPKRVQAPLIPERTTSAINGPIKSASVPSLASLDPTMQITAKPISVSNPTKPANANMILAVVSELDNQPPTPSKSPSRTYRDSPLKHVKNKLSSILKTSKGLLASSAAISAEGKSLLLSPSSTRLGLLMGPSTESLAIQSHNGSSSDLTRPELSRQASVATMKSSASVALEASDVFSTHGSPSRPESPSRTNRKTRASLERERREQKQREKEQKEVQRMADQMGKLEKMREKEREKARVFVEEQAAATEKPPQVAPQRDIRGLKQQQPELEEEEASDVEMALQQPRSQPMPKAQTSSPRAPAKPTRTSPRKTKATTADADVDMADALGSMLPPPPPAHSTAPANLSLPRSAQGPRTIRRPVKPAREAAAKPKQAPTVIRVNTSSSQHQQQQSSQFHPSNSVLAASLHETLAGSLQHQPSQTQMLKNKASTASLHTKPSLQSLKSSVSSSGRPKALELAAKRKEAEEREAQRKRDVKAEMDRKRAAMQEQEEQRKLELQRQKEREREQANAEAAAAKKAAAAQQRQAAIEKAKQTKAPPPAQRTQLPSRPSGDYRRNDPPRPQSRLATATGSTVSRSQEELHRPVNKPLSKRPLPAADSAETQGHGRNGTAGGNATYQQKDAKRIRMSEEFDEDELEMGGHVPRVSSIKGPPVRPSGGFKKVNIRFCPAPILSVWALSNKTQDLPNKSVFGNSYSTAPTNVSRDLFKATVTAQHNHQAGAVNPMDMAQMSKATISFAPTANSAASAAAAAAASGSVAPGGAPNPHKTPLRPAGIAAAGKSTAKSTIKSTAKSAAKSSPRFPNGDAIELPEIQTDGEDSEDDGGHINVAPWADSPDLRRALMRQETVDPFQVFGPPGPLNMEEVFNKSKDRWNKFRARTSSANWSGADRLTEEDIRKDLAARDKIRREGGWSYDLGRDMM